jgi:hypothetical protein
MPLLRSPSILALAMAVALAVPARGAAPEATPTVAERSAGLERHDGLVPYYWDARKGQMLLEVSRFDEEMLYGSGLAGGAGLLEVPLDRGQLGDLGLVRFERVGPRVLLHQLQVTHRSGVADPERTRVVRESFPTAVLAALPIVAEDPGRVLVDATEFLLKDTQIGPAPRSASGARTPRARSSASTGREPSPATPRSRPSSPSPPTTPRPRWPACSPTVAR